MMEKFVQELKSFHVSSLIERLICRDWNLLCSKRMNERNVICSSDWRLMLWVLLLIISHERFSFTLKSCIKLCDKSRFVFVTLVLMKKKESRNEKWKMIIEFDFQMKSFARSCFNEKSKSCGSGRDILL